MLQGILKAREARWQRRCQLAEQYQSPVITLTLNIPGPEKTKEIYLEAHKRITREFCQCLKNQGYFPHFEEYQVAADGAEVYLVLTGKPSALIIKELAIEFEENYPLGRLIDVDVLDEIQNVISRKDLGKLERKCLLCDAPARECIITRKHSTEHLMKIIGEILEEIPDQALT